MLSGNVESVGVTMGYSSSERLDCSVRFIHICMYVLYTYTHIKRQATWGGRYNKDSSGPVFVRHPFLHSPKRFRRAAGVKTDTHSRVILSNKNPENYRNHMLNVSFCACQNAEIILWNARMHCVLCNYNIIQYIMLYVINKEIQLLFMFRNVSRVVLLYQYILHKGYTYIVCIWIYCKVCCRITIMTECNTVMLRL